MAGINTGIAPDMVLSGLDEVFFSKFNESPGPNMATPKTADVFIQDSVDRAGVQTQVMNDGGMWDSRGELEDLSETTARADFSKTFTVASFAQSLPISKHYFDDEQYGTVNELIRKMALKGRLTDIKNAFGLYRNAFTTTTTNEGTALISDSHTNLNGDTVDNKLTATLSDSSLNDAIVKLMEQKDQTGDIVGFEASTLLVPPALFKKACEITDSELRSGTADNELNVFSAKYGIKLLQSNYLGSAAGGSDTAWFLLAKDHSVKRWERQPVVTDLVDYKYSDNFVYKYKAEFRNVYGAPTYEGIVGSDGSV